MFVQVLMLCYKNLNELFGQLNIFSHFSEIIIEFSSTPWLYLFSLRFCLFIFFSPTILEIFLIFHKYLIILCFISMYNGEV